MLEGGCLTKCHDDEKGGKECGRCSKIWYIQSIRDSHGFRLVDRIHGILESLRGSMDVVFLRFFQNFRI